MSKYLWALGIIVLIAGGYFIWQGSMPASQTNTGVVNSESKAMGVQQQEEDETIILVNLVRGTSEQDATPLVRLLEEHKSVYSAKYVSPEQMLAERGFPSDAPRGIGNPFDGMILVHVNEPSLRAEVAAFIKAQNNSVVQYVDW